MLFFLWKLIYGKKYKYKNEPITIKRINLLFHMECVSKNKCISNGDFEKAYLHDKNLDELFSSGKILDVIDNYD